jgi:hypothetical protein
VPREEYIQINVPGIAYSVVFVPLWAEDFAPYFEQIEKFRQAHANAFSEAVSEAAPSGPPPPSTVPPWQPPQAAQRPQNAAPAQRGQQQNGGNSYGVTLLCGEHDNAQLRPSVKNKDMDFIDDLGREIPASWFHTLPDGKTHTVYQSKAVWA